MQYTMDQIENKQTKRNELRGVGTKSFFAAENSSSGPSQKHIFLRTHVEAKKNEEKANFTPIGSIRWARLVVIQLGPEVIFSLS